MNKNMKNSKFSHLDVYKKFKEKIKLHKKFIDDFSMLISNNPIVCLTKNKTHILNTVFLRSAINTLNSIQNCCNCGCFSDANVLVRKYRDDLLLYLFILEVLDNREGLTNDEINEFTDGEMDANKLTELVFSTMSVIKSGSRKDNNDKAVDAWFNNDASKGKYKNKLSINNYFNYIKSNEEIKECINKHDLHSDWEEIRQRLNDFTHNNGKEFLRHNILELLSKNEIKNTISQITQDISFVTSFFLVVIILIKPNFIMSTDYVDSMDVGIEPPKDSQYWVAPFIKEYIDNNIVKLHPNLKSFLHHNNKYGMKIE